MTAHGRFGTAVVRFPDGRHWDVVTARRETYAEPAALPDVEAGTIEDDLARRDFTVNAIAASLGDDFGRLRDPHGGRADLDAGTIRVLHDRSFVDDPTRIFRAIRYENRLGFRMDEDTERLAREGMDGRRAPVGRRLAGGGGRAPVGGRDRTHARAPRRASAARRRSTSVSSSGSTHCATSSIPALRSGGFGSR